MVSSGVHRGNRTHDHLGTCQNLASGGEGVGILNWGSEMR